ncbi:MAG TPA: hypothetical protein VFG04_03605 [Planctomycetaceae bacterium]|jgi:hypothetical protein|nr:hypothetical protein [Planctomycetaceae bacterium]
MHQVLRRIVPCCAFGLVFLSATATRAGFIASTTGPVDVISAPASATPGSLVSNSYQAWDESTGTISSPLQVNMLGQAGQYDGLTNYSTLNGTLAAGTKYDSVMVQLDPKTGFPPQSPIATLTFTGKIIGLALFGPSLDGSDVYGNPSTTYPHGLPAIGVQNRGIDMTHNEKFSVSSDGLTLSLQLAGGFGSFDEIRIFTAPAVASVPEPMSLAIWSGIGLVVVLKRRSSGLASRLVRFGKI